MSSLFSTLEPAWRRLAYGNRGGLRLAAPALVPLSWLYGLAVRLRRTAYQAGVFKAQSFPLLIISVGNLTVGGVGKTPFTLYLAHRLKRVGYNPAILLRGYGRKSDKSELIAPGSFRPQRIAELGDEASLLAFLSDFPIAVNPNRAEGVRRIMDETDCNVVLLDDGFQHLKLRRDLDLVMFDGRNPFGNGRCLPYGPLREPRSALRCAHAAIVNGDKEGNAAKRLGDCCPALFFGGLKWIGLYPLRHWMNQEGGTPLRLEAYRQTPVILASGVGSPGRLKRQAQSLGLTVHEHIRYPDHHWFTKSDLQVLAIKSRGHSILITEKDAVRWFAVKDVPNELAEKTFVIHAAWQMQNADSFDRWLKDRMAEIDGPFDAVEFDSIDG